MQHNVFFVVIFSLMGASGKKIEGTSDALRFLAKLGYMREELLDSMNLIDAAPYIKQFQKMYSINVTGDLDEETMQMMNAPRCGNADMNKNVRRVKRYVHNGFEWQKRMLTYKISEFSKQPELDRLLVIRNVRNAFQQWEDVTNLRFTQVEQGEVDIELKFLPQRHGDNNDFDDAGEILAHAFAPGQGLGGDVHFNDVKMWTTDLISHGKYGVFPVVLHEIGHALGLHHSNVPRSVMMGSFSHNPVLNLHEDDIRGIQALYGVKESKMRSIEPTGRTRTSHPRLLPQRINNSLTPEVSEMKGNEIMPNPAMMAEARRSDLCTRPEIDAITTLPDKSVIIFQGKYTFQKNPNAGWGKGQAIGAVFTGLDDNVDAAFTSNNGYTYIFKRDKYWRFKGFRMSRGYPRSIARWFPGIPNDIDAAFEWPQNKNIYFFKGDKFWAFTPNRKPPVSDNYPRWVSELNLPSSIDAAFVSPQVRTYLFKGSQYWRLDDYELRVAKAGPPYPRDARLTWFQCTMNKPDTDDR